MADPSGGVQQSRGGGHQQCVDVADLRHGEALHVARRQGQLRYNAIIPSVHDRWQKNEEMPQDEPANANNGDEVEKRKVPS